MFSINRDDKSVPPKIHLVGTIDENVDFSPLLESKAQTINLNLREITRINSVGVKVWRDFFGEFRKVGGKLHFYEASPAIVSTINYLKGFILVEELHSICIPFLCDSCAKITILSLSVDELRKQNFNPASPKCSFCSSTTQLDELPDEYFAFLVG